MCWNSVGGGFVVNDKTKGVNILFFVVILRAEPEFQSVDENLFYKGVDKSAVHGARLNQTHSLSDPMTEVAPTSRDENDPGHPPYPFESGDALLALTKKHNVRHHVSKT